MNLNVSDIQHFSLGDGEGIRTTVFLKGCNLRCPWCHNPETHSSAPHVILDDCGGEKVYGRQIPVEQVVDEAMEDFDFYAESGGGVTVSGGEALLQADGVAELARRLCENGVHVILDTAGNAEYSEFEKVQDSISEYFYDVKACSESDYRRVIGGDFKLILGNLEKLIAGGKKVCVRVPLIPDFNTDLAYCEKMCECLRSVGANRVDLIPFHRLGSAKYRALNMTYLYRNVLPPSPEELESIADVYRKYFITKIEK